MTQLLLRIFIKDYTDSSGQSVRSAIGALSGIVGIICNLLLFIMKLVVGTIAASVSITADAMNNLSDATSSIVTLIGFHLAKKPADNDHPYGHARYEYLSGLAVAALIIVIGFEFAKTSVGKIINPAPVEFSIPVCIVLGASIIVKLWLFAFNRNLGHRIDSASLAATAADSRNDCISTGAVLIAAIAEFALGWQIDGIMGLGVALFILYSGAMLAKDTISPLLGENASPELKKLIIDVIDSEPQVLGYHDLMVHDYGPGQRFASIHAEMDYRLDPLICHELIDNLERICLEKHNVHLIIHYDPIVTDNEELTMMKEIVQEILTQIDPRISTHDFRMVKASEYTNLIFDIALPAELMKKQRVIKEQMDAAIRERQAGTYYTVVTFDMASFN